MRFFATCDLKGAGIVPMNGAEIVPNKNVAR